MLRAMFGLVSLLVVAFIIAWLFTMQWSGGGSKAAKKAKIEARQIAGFGEDMVRAIDSVTYAPQPSGQPLTGLDVQSVTPGGAMDTHFGLMAGDKVIEVGGNQIDAIAVGDEELAKALIAEAYQRRQTLTVIRNGERMVLPDPAVQAAKAAAAAAAANNPNGAAPAAPNGSATPAPAPQTDNRTPLGRQLDLLEGMGASGELPE